MKKGEPMRKGAEARREAEAFVLTLPTKIVQRFAKRWTLDPATGCWIWAGAGKTYGKIVVLDTLLHAHRVSWLLHRGEIPEGFEVLHSCPGGDRKACVNYMHLRTGTHRENMEDAFARGLQRVIGPRGATHPKAKIADRIEELYRRRAAGESLRTIGAALGVTAGAVHAVLRGDSYRDAPRPG